mgnify:CR=1 FL=1
MNTYLDILAVLFGFLLLAGLLWLFLTIRREEAAIRQQTKNLKQATALLKAAVDAQTLSARPGASGTIPGQQNRKQDTQ